MIVGTDNLRPPHFLRCCWDPSWFSGGPKTAARTLLLPGCLAGLLQWAPTGLQGSAVILPTSALVLWEPGLSGPSCMVPGARSAHMDQVPSLRGLGWAWSPAAHHVRPSLSSCGPGQEAEVLRWYILLLMKSDPEDTVKDRVSKPLVSV